ncbi:MAG: DUF1853 family protein [SAR324 cluster bacterium]|nr:DUF1853 family protein [SAR324 cluster bacterium]
MICFGEDHLKDHKASQLLRDLHWVLESPLLIRKEEFGQESKAVDSVWAGEQIFRHQGWLNSVQENPEILEEYFQKRQTWKVGRYFEQLISFWLIHSPFFNLKAWNLQIFDGHRTLGELDFIFEDRDRAIMLHWESSVKYYLGCCCADGGVEWIGPNARDRLDLKLGKMLDHQSRLSEHPEARKTLEQMDIFELHPEVFLKGYLFYPHSRSGEVHAPLNASRNHLKGYWISSQEINVLSSDPSKRWMILKKPYWLSRAITRDENRLLSFKKLEAFVQNEFLHSAKPLLLAEMMEQESGLFLESTRCFIVSESWPDR